MALQKNIKEVESTEAGFVANAAAKNDGFLTDVTGYPMIKMRGNEYDYWFPEKSRDELGAYTYYDKTVKDLTVLNDCIVQRRLSSYGDADTYLDLSTDDQAVLNVGGVPFLTVAESESAAIGTLGGNLAVGVNNISADGLAGKGTSWAPTSGLLANIATAFISGDTRTVLRLYDDTAFEIGVGAGINLYGKTSDSGSYANFGGIKVSKENGVSGDNSASFYIQSKKHGSNPINALRLDSSQNGYITNKLMVGSLTETPTVKLAVYDDDDDGCLMSISDVQSGPNSGLVLGIADTVEGPEVVLTSQCIIRADGYSRNLYFQGETTVPNVFSNYIACEFGRTSGTFDVKTVTIADKLVVDGDLRIDGDAQIDGNLQVDGSLQGTFDADDKILASAITAKYAGSSTHILDIKGGYGGSIARFSEYDEVWKSLTVYGDLYVDGLTASQIVETDANKKLISVAKGTAYNANFGTGSNDVCRGNDSRIPTQAVNMNSSPTFIKVTALSGKIDSIFLEGAILSNVYLDGATAKLYGSGYAGMVSFDTTTGSWVFSKSSASGSAGDTISWTVIDTIA